MTGVVQTRSSRGLLALTGLRQVGPATAERIATRFATLEEVEQAPLSQLQGVATAAAIESIRQRGGISESSRRAEAVLEASERHGVGVLSVFDGGYPRGLLRLVDRPPVLYVKGRLNDVERCVACIGTREPSEFGEKVTDRIAGQIVEAGWIIVSGLATGVDSIAHRAAVDRQGRTIAILAGGLEKIYPAHNAKLADEILAGGGALISEHPIGVPPAPRNLVQRDRLQSGMSVATIVMQTDIKGGSMHTVRFTLMQDRLLFAPVPQGRHAQHPKSQGILALAGRTGPEFAEIIGADGPYQRLLLTKYARRTVATPLESRDDYASMLATLERRLTDGEPPVVGNPEQTSML